MELLERGVRLALESGRPIAHVARDLGINSEVLRKRVRQVEADQGLRPDLPTSEEREEITSEVQAERAEVAAALEQTLRALITPDVIIEAVLQAVRVP